MLCCASPSRLPICRHAVLCVVARSLTYLMYCSLPRSLHALPDNKYAALNRLPIPPCCVVRRRVSTWSLAYFTLCFVVVRRSLGHALNVRSLLRVCHALPTEKYAALNALDTSFRRQAAGCVQLRRTHILTGFARIIPDTRPSGSSLAPSLFMALPAIFSAALYCSSFPPLAGMTSKSGENDGCLYFRRSLFAILLSPPSSPHKKQKTPQSVILAGRRGSRRGVSRGRRQSRWRFKPHYGVTTLIVHFRRTHILTGFARIIPDTRPSGSSLAPSLFMALPAIFSASLYCSSPPPSAEMTNMSGENDACVFLPPSPSPLQKQRPIEAIGRA